MHEDVARRPRNRDAVRPEQPPDLEQGLALDVLYPLRRIGNPEPEFKLDGALAEAEHEGAFGAGVFRMRAGRPAASFVGPSHDWGS